MTRKQKIQNLLNRLDDLQAKNPVGSVERLLKEEESKARENVSVPTSTALKVLARGLAQVQGEGWKQQIVADLESAKSNTETKIQGVSTDFSQKIESLVEEVRSAEGRGQELTKAEIASVLERFDEFRGSFEIETSKLSSKDALIEGEVSRAIQEVEKINQKLNIPIDDSALKQNIVDTKKANLNALEAQEMVEALRKTILRRLSQIGGGNANRNIAIGGNTSVLSMFTDINIKAGSNVTLSYSNNQTTKYLDLTIAASGGGSSVAGTVRSVNNVSTSQTMGSVAGTDYVYIASAGINLTLPSANAITNLYTVKNIAASSILVSRDSADTIEGNTNLILATQYTAVDLISDGISNWNIT